MLVYIETTEGLVKPLVILPAAIMPITPPFFYPYFLMMSLSPLFLLIHSFSQPTSPLFNFTKHFHTPYPLCSPYLTQFGNIFYLWQNYVVRDLSGPLVRICDPTTQLRSQAEPDGSVRSLSWSLLHFQMASTPLLDLSPYHSFHILHLRSLVDLSLFTHSPNLSLCMLNLPGLPSDLCFMCYLPCSAFLVFKTCTLYS